MSGSGNSLSGECQGSWPSASGLSAECQESWPSAYSACLPIFMSRPDWHGFDPGRPHCNAGRMVGSIGGVAAADCVVQCSGALYSELSTGRPG